MNIEHAKALRRAPLSTPTSLPEDAVRDVSGALNAVLQPLPLKRTTVVSPDSA